MELILKKSKTGLKRESAKSQVWKSIYNYKYMYLFLVPGILFFIVFNYLPMYGITLAFKEYNFGVGFKGIVTSPWVGFDKFRLLWNSPDFLNAFKNTIIISLLKIVFGFPFPILLAMMIHEVNSSKLMRGLQALYTFPHFLSWVIVSGIFINLLSSDGALNTLLHALNFNSIPFLTTPWLFRPLLVITDIWKNSGWSCIMYLAAIVSINPTLYEVASLDGAGRLQKAWYITWPGIRNIAAVLLILAFGGIMNTGFDQVFNLYNAPVQSTGDIIDTYIFRQSFQLAGDFGFITAVGLFKGVINCFLMLTADTIVKKLGRVSGV